MLIFFLFCVLFDSSSVFSASTIVLISLLLNSLTALILLLIIILESNLFLLFCICSYLLLAWQGNGIFLLTWGINVSNVNIFSFFY